MPRGLNNWTYRDVDRFLRKRGFVLRYSESGSGHRYYVRVEKVGEYVVTVAYHGDKTAYGHRVMRSMIAQSGIVAQEWSRGV